MYARELTVGGTEIEESRRVSIKFMIIGRDINFFVNRICERARFRTKFDCR